MEVEVAVEAEDVVTGSRRRTSTAFVVHVALDPADRPYPVTPSAES